MDSSYPQRSRDHCNVHSLWILLIHRGQEIIVMFIHYGFLAEINITTHYNTSVFFPQYSHLLLATSLVWQCAPTVLAHHVAYLHQCLAYMQQRLALRPNDVSTAFSLGRKSSHFLTIKISTDSKPDLEKVQSHQARMFICLTMDLFSFI